MTSPAPDYEEMAALHALGLLDEEGTRQLLDAAARDPEVRRLIDALDETAAHLGSVAPEVAPPPDLRDRIMSALPAERGKIVAFPQWIPYAIAACLLGLAIIQSLEIKRLQTGRKELQAQLLGANDNVAVLQKSNAMINLRLTALEAKDPAYAAAKVLVAWDPNQQRGVIALQDLPLTPAGHDYQLWVLDPNAPSPISAGVVTAARPFAVAPVSVPHPGFAISLEPAGGSPSPTGPILFAVAPAE